MPLILLFLFLFLTACLSVVACRCTSSSSINLLFVTFESLVFNNNSHQVISFCYISTPLFYSLLSLICVILRLLLFIPVSIYKPIDLVMGVILCSMCFSLILIEKKEKNCFFLFLFIILLKLSFFPIHMVLHMFGQFNMWLLVFWKTFPTITLSLLFFLFFPSPPFSNWHILRLSILSNPFFWLLVNLYLVITYNET